MRYTFAQILMSEMIQNENIFFLTGDLGYKIFDDILNKFPSRAFTLGASEQLMLGMAVGLANSGKIPFVYSITPFLLYRPFEIIRNYLNHEKANVKMVASGRDVDYSHDGFSHYAGDDKEFLKKMENIKTEWPNDNSELTTALKTAIDNVGPHYINLKR